MPGKTKKTAGRVVCHSMAKRTEKDSLGLKEVPGDAYYGIHTVRSLENFNSAGEHLSHEIILGIVKLKLACCKANVRLGTLSKQKGKAIEKACRKILSGSYTDQFPVDVFQSGSGTSSNMNVNEVLANIASEILGGKLGDKTIHPNDDVNKGQSTNNIFPSAVRLATFELSGNLLLEIKKLAKSFRKKEFNSVVKSGRTHLQDAVPITLGQEFNAYASALEKSAERIAQSREKMLILGVGGNAVGTGINTKKEFREVIISELNAIDNSDYKVPRDGIEITQFLTDMAEVSSSLRLFSLDLLKITNDLRLLASGPNTAIGEISLPAVEPGSSIMPGKVNPSICEATNMACIYVLGKDHTIAAACGAGQLELNTHMPLIGQSLIKSLNVLIRCCAMLREKCINGVKANHEVCKKHFLSSAGLATVLAPKLGYDKVAELVKESLKQKISIKEIILRKKILSEKEFEKLISGSTHPNL